MSYFSGGYPSETSQYQFDKTHRYLNGIRRRKGNGHRSEGGGLAKLFSCHTKIPLALAGLASVGLAPRPARAAGMTSRILLLSKWSLRCQGLSGEVHVSQ